MLMKLQKKLTHNLYRFKYINAPKLNLKVPVDLSLELSSFCTLHCSYCYHADQDNLPFAKKLMDFDLARRIIEQGAELGVHSIKYNGRGESTMHPRFRELTTIGKMLSTQSTYIDRITNSNFFFRSRQDEIFEGLCNQTKVKVSFDSFIPEVFEKQRTGAKFEVVLDNVNRFYNFPLRHETRLVIQAVRTNLNKDEDIEGEVKKRWPQAEVSVRNMVADRVNADLEPLEYAKRDYSQRQSCIQAHARMIIHSDGKVAPCCPAFKGDLIIGDTNKDSLHTIYNSIVAKQLRLELLSKEAFKKEPCKNCSSFETFKGYKPPKDS